MYTPAPEPAALLESTQRRPQCVDLYTITLANGMVLRWHDSDREVVSFGGTEWLLGPGIERSKLEWGLTLDVEGCEIVLHPRADGTFADVRINGVGLLEAVIRGEFDGADV